MIRLSNTTIGSNNLKHCLPLMDYRMDSSKRPMHCVQSHLYNQSSLKMKIMIKIN